MLWPDARLDVIHLRTMPLCAGLVVTCERKVLHREKCYKTFGSGFSFTAVFKQTQDTVANVRVTKLTM